MMWWDGVECRMACRTLKYDETAVGRGVGDQVGMGWKCAWCEVLAASLRTGRASCYSAAAAFYWAKLWFLLTRLHLPSLCSLTPTPPSTPPIQQAPAAADCACAAGHRPLLVPQAAAAGCGGLHVCLQVRLGLAVGQSDRVWLALTFDGVAGWLWRGSWVVWYTGTVAWRQLLPAGGQCARICCAMPAHLPRINPSIHPHPLPAALQNGGGDAAPRAGASRLLHVVGDAVGA